MPGQIKRYAVAAIVALGFSLAPGELRTSQEAQEKLPPGKSVGHSRTGISLA